MPDEAQAPVPDTYVETAPFWAAARKGRLALQFCTVARRFQHPPRPVSVYTGRPTLEWRDVSGEGTVYAYTHVAERAGDGTPRRAVIATVALAEGVQIAGRILGDTAALAIGAPVTLDWDEPYPGVRYPAFRIAAVT